MADNRIKEHILVKKSDIRPNPQNWRLHPQSQLDGLTAIMEDVGFVDELLVVPDPDKKAKYLMVDGEARWTLHEAEDEIPVSVLDLDNEEIKKILATIDPISGLAGNDPQKLEGLLKEISDDVSVEMKTLLQDIDEKYATGFTELPPEETDAAFVPHYADDGKLVEKRADGLPVSASQIVIAVSPEEHADIMLKMRSFAELWGETSFGRTFVRLVKEMEKLIAKTDGGSAKE